MMKPETKPSFALRLIFAAGVFALAAGCAAPGPAPRDQASPVDEMNRDSGRAINSPYRSY